jgi:hypothetical protein
MFVRVVVSAIANQIPWDQIKEGQHPPIIDIQTKNWLLLMCTSALVFLCIAIWFFFALELNKTYIPYKLWQIKFSLCNFLLKFMLKITFICLKSVMLFYRKLRNL